MRNDTLRPCWYCAGRRIKYSTIKKTNTVTWHCRVYCEYCKTSGPINYAIDPKQAEAEARWVWNYWSELLYPNTLWQVSRLGCSDVGRGYKNVARVEAERATQRSE